MIPREVTVSKCDAHWRHTLAYSGEVVYADEAVIVARCPWPAEHTVDLGELVIAPGDCFIEFYYPGRWFNLFAIYDALGRLKGWYGNVTRPVHMDEDGATIRWADLALDLLVLPDGRQVVLDEDEFAALTLEADERQQARDALATMQCLAREGQAPFGTALLQWKSRYP